MQCHTKLTGRSLQPTVLESSTPQQELQILHWAVIVRSQHPPSFPPPVSELSLGFYLFFWGGGLSNYELFAESFSADEMPVSSVNRRS